METVEVVIRIPKKCKEFLDNGGKVDWLDAIPIIDAIANGTILPEGHGRLVDSNVLWDAYQDLGQDFYEAFDFAEANAVIEADREVADV